MVDCLADDTLMQTRPDHAAIRHSEVHILIGNLHKFKVFGDRKLVREFSDEGWNVKGLNKLLKKLMTKRTGGG